MYFTDKMSGAVRALILIAYFLIGPWVAAAGSAIFIVYLWFMMLFAIFKITIRWHKENKTLEANPGLVNEYSSIVSAQSNSVPSRAEKY